MKKLGKRTLSLMLAFVLAFTTFMAVMVIDAKTYTTPGGKLTYSFDESTGTLTISGTGDMYDFDAAIKKAPWVDIKESIKKVVINEGVTAVGEFAFYNCTNLTSVSLPSTVTQIRSGGFATTNIGSYGAFRDCTSLTEINFSDNLKEIQNAAFRGCTSLKKVTIPDSITSLGGAAFYGCTGISEVTFGSGLSEVPDRLFYNCSNLAKINWNDAITSVGAWSFFGTRLTEVQLPEHISSISARCFGDCNFLDDVYIYNRKLTFKLDGIYGPFDSAGATNTKDVRIHGYTGSTAQTFAEGKNYTFVPLDSCAHEHTHINVIKAATCTEDGLQETYCDDCNTVIVPDTTIPATGHDYEVTSTSDDTAVDGHTRQYEKCKTCGNETVVLTHAETEESGTINKKYVWVEGYYDYDCNATCTSSGWEKYTCTVEGCGVTQRNAVQRTGHTVEKWTVTKQPTCTDEGSRTGTCSVCNQEVTEAIAKTGHTVDTENPIKTEDKTDSDGHIYKTYACTVCGQQTTEITHAAWVEGQYTPTIIAKVTCTTDGIERDKCDICDETRTVTIPSKGEHTWEATETIEPTCTTKGQTNYTCTVCGATKRDDVVDALGHNYVEQKDLAVAATCTETGSKSYKCSRCSATKTDVVAAKGHFPKQGTKVVTKEADCENDGSFHATCFRCGEEYDQVINALGHDYQNVEVAIEDKPGHVLSTPTCTRCGQTETAEIVHKEWVEGYYTHRVITEGTCLTGEIYIDTCSICNKTSGSTQGSPLGHEFRMLRIYNEPSSTTLNDKVNVEPYSFIYTCKHCGTLEAVTGKKAFEMWDIYYYNRVPEGRTSISNSSYLDVNNDGIINAKDYAELYSLNKKYLKYVEEQSQKTEESSTTTE